MPVFSWENLPADLLGALARHAGITSTDPPAGLRKLYGTRPTLSGSWRTLAGARAYCTIRSYLSTMRKHDVDLLDGLRRMFEGHAWLPGET